MSTEESRSATSSSGADRTRRRQLRAARLVTSRLTASRSAREVLSVVAENLANGLNDIHVSTAFNRLGKTARPSTGVDGDRLVDHAAFRSLLRLAESFAAAAAFSERSVANVLHGLAKLHGARHLGVDPEGPLVVSALTALETAVRETAAREMKPQEVSNTVWAYGALGVSPREDTWAALEEAVQRTAPQMVPQALANTAWGFAKLGRDPREATLAALETAVGRVASSMNAQDVANVLWSFGRFRDAPRDETLEAIGIASRRVARHMTAQGVSTAMWGYGRLDRMPGRQVWAALEEAVRRTARDMTPLNVSHVMYAYGAVDATPDERAWRALESATARVGGDMNEGEVSSVVYAYAKLGRIPNRDAWRVLERAMVRVGGDMDSREVANALYAVARLGIAPREETWSVLDQAALRELGKMTPQDVVTAAWSHGVVAMLHGVDYPPSHAALWREVSDMGATAFEVDELHMLFHTHLMHRYSDSTRPSVRCPEWLMENPRDEWRRIVPCVTESRGAQHVALTLEEMGVQHDVERITADGYFSMDIYLPDHDVALEFDGPSHYYKSFVDTSSPEALRGASMLRTAKTELRDILLSERCAKVVTVPWFEWRHLHTERARQTYLREKLLREADVEI